MKQYAGKGQLSGFEAWQQQIFMGLIQRMHRGLDDTAHSLRSLSNCKIVNDLYETGVSIIYIVHI